MTRLIFESLEHELPRYKRILLWLHTLVCLACTRYRQQLSLLREVERNLPKLTEDNKIIFGRGLSQEGRERIKVPLSRQFDSKNSALLSPRCKAADQHEALRQERNVKRTL